MAESHSPKLYELVELVHAVARQLPAPDNLEPGPCTPVEIGVMRFIGKNPGCSAREAGSACRLPPSNFSRVLKQLVAKGLLEKKSDSRDARIVRLHPTGLVDENVKRMREAWSQALQGVAFGPESLIEATRVLGRIESHLSSERSNGS